MTPEIRLTSGDDYFEFTEGMQWTNVFGEAGNDTFVFVGTGGQVIGGPGNDTIENRLVEQWWWYDVAYWNSPNPVRIDLSLGRAEDGWGGVDTLINITKVSFGGRDGDVALGSSKNDVFNLGGFYQPGRLYVDGRDGVDTVRIWSYALDDFQVRVSVDAKTVVLSKNGYVATLDNIEALQFDDRGQDRQTYRVVDLIDTSRVGEQTLVAPGSTGWSGKPGSPASLTYSFMLEPPSYGGLEAGASFESPKTNYQNAVRSILGELSQQTGLRFEEVPDSSASYGQLRFGASQQSQTKGYAFIPGQANKELAGDVWLDIETTQLLQPGQEGWAALLHEIGHALGLDHPLAESNSVSGRPMLVSKWNHQGFTVMSETVGPSGLWPQWFGALDLQALQYLYGNVSNTSGTKAQLVALNDVVGGAAMTVVLQGEGENVLDASKTSVGALLDLRPGYVSSVGVNTQGVALGNLTLDFNSKVTQAVGSPYDDVFIGNNLDNIFWTGLGNDQIDGREGKDTVVIPGSIQQYSVTAAYKAGTFYIDSLDGESGSKQVSNVEVIRFDDAQISLPSLVRSSATKLPPPTENASLQTLDLLQFSALPTPTWASSPSGPNGSTGDLSQARFSAASMITVAFGADSIRPFLDIGMSFYGNGMSHAEVAKLIADNQIIESLLGSPENGAWISHVYKNVVGTPPGPAVQADFVQLLSSNQFSRAGLLELAAGLTPFVEQQASLVGFSLLQ